MSNAYAATEAVPIISSLFDTEISDSMSVGLVVDGARIRICAPDNRRLYQRNLGLDITTKEILEDGTVKRQAQLLSSGSNTKSLPVGLDVKREGPPDTDDVAIILGEPEVMTQIKREEEDVEDILPSWDLGYEVFGNVDGTDG
ncbi:hypothetical protein BST61_g9723 [Cercospora zeina]